ncbi:MAG: hypothetical protein K6E17_06490 [Clostridiales bacterium]|nr:hypothetical protein [Clostridiales bacterium]
MKKKIAIVSLLLVMVVLLTACANKGAEDAQVAEKALDINGTWTLVDASSKDVDGEDMAAAMAMIKEVGATVELTFDNGKMTMHMEFMGQSEDQETTYTIEDGKLVSEGSKLDIKLDGDKLTLSEGDNAIVLEKKK